MPLVKGCDKVFEGVSQLVTFLLQFLNRADQYVGVERRIVALGIAKGSPLPVGHLLHLADGQPENHLADLGGTGRFGDWVG